MFNMQVWCCALFNFVSILNFSLHFMLVGFLVCIFFCLSLFIALFFLGLFINFVFKKNWFHVSSLNCDFCCTSKFCFFALLHYIRFVLLLMLTIVFCVDLFHKMQVFIILFYGVKICIAMTIFFHFLYVCFYFDCFSYLVAYIGFWFFWFTYCTSCFKNCFLASLLKIPTICFHSLSFCCYGQHGTSMGFLLLVLSSFY